MNETWCNETNVRDVFLVLCYRSSHVQDATAPMPHAHVVVVLTLNRSFYSTTSAVPPVSFLIHPREIQILLSHT